MIDTLSALDQASNSYEQLIKDIDYNEQDKANERSSKEREPDLPKFDLVTPRISRSLENACRNGDVEAARQALAEGASKDGEDFPPLFLASHEGHTGVMQVLVDAGVDLEKCGPGGIRPLHAACQKGHAAAARILLDAGADASAEWESSNALQLAIFSSNLEAVRVFQKLRPEMMSQVPKHIIARLNGETPRRCRTPRASKPSSK